MGVKASREAEPQHVAPTMFALPEEAWDEASLKAFESDVDYYVLLGVHKKATTATIRAAYLARVATEHPDTPIAQTGIPTAESRGEAERGLRDAEGSEKKGGVRRGHPRGFIAKEVGRFLREARRVGGLSPSHE